MRKYFLLLNLLVALGLFVPMGVVLASYDYYIPITIYNNGTGDLTGIPVLITLNNSQLADMGYILSSGLGTEVMEGATGRSYLVADTRLGITVPSILGYQSRVYHYRLGVDPVQTGFPFMVGEGGSVAITDHADLELGDDFRIEFEGWIDTSVEVAQRYPDVANTNTSTDSGYNHTVSLPSGIEAGDLLLVFFACVHSGANTISWPGGWTELFMGDDAGTEKAGVIYKVASGSEGGNVTVATLYSVNSAHQSFRITGYDGLPEIATSSFATSAIPNPPSLSPSWGNSKTLWIAGFGGSDTTSLTLSSYPSDYDNGQFTKSSSVYAYAGSARRELEALSEDPGVFTLSGDLKWVAWTVGIRGDPNVLIGKAAAFEVYVSDGGELSAVIFGSPVRRATVTGLSSDEYLVEVWANATTFGIDIDESTENSTALGGASVPDNSNDWVIVIPYFDYYNQSVPGFGIEDDFEWGIDEDPLSDSGGGIDWLITAAGTSRAEINTTQSYAGTRSARLYQDGASDPRAGFNQTPISNSQVISVRVRKDDSSKLVLYYGDGTRAIAVGYLVNEDLFYYDGVTYDTGIDIVVDAWALLEIKNTNWSAGTYDIYHNGTLAKSGASMQTTANWNGEVEFRNQEGASEVWLDNIQVAGGSLEAWYQPATMVLGASLPDRTGNGHTGTITWGSNPGAIEVTIGGMEPYSAFTAVEEGEVEVPLVVPIPGVIDMAPSAGATGEGLPLYVNFQRAADSLDWTVPTTYAVMFIFVAIAVGVGGLVAVGSVWGWVVGFGGTAALFGAVQDTGGYNILPMWVTLICVAFAILTGYVWRYT